MAAWRAGSALAGCSAGAMALSARVPSLRNPGGGETEGLGLLPHLRVIPHFDLFAARVPDLLGRVLQPYDARITVIGVDEDTALVGGPHEWTVRGRGSAWKLTPDGREQWPAGSRVAVPE